MSTWQTEYLDQIEDCEKRESMLTEWEASFLDSVKRQLEEGRHLSPKQIETLDNIWERATKKG